LKIWLYNDDRGGDEDKRGSKRTIEHEVDHEKMKNIASEAEKMKSINPTRKDSLYIQFLDTFPYVMDIVPQDHNNELTFEIDRLPNWAIL
jgi:hypothetical protein